MTHGRRQGVALRVWAVAGVVFLFAEAAWRLALRGIAAIRIGLEPLEWLALGLVTAAFVYGEGVRALQRRWVPWVLERVERLPAERSLLFRVAAPLYAMSLVGSSRHAVLRAWAGVAAIIAAVFIVSRFPHPWRGIVDTAVAAALVWGGLALVGGTVAILRTGSRGS